MTAAPIEHVLAPRGERLSVRSRAAVAQLELRGELPCWQQAIPMRLDGGWAEAALRLAPGVYEYKLAAPGGAWLLDGDNPRTRGRDGAVNNVLVVAGCDEPVLHAPAAPWIERRGDGALIVRAALRRDAGAALSLRCDDGAGVTSRAMRRVGGEDQHHLFEIALAGAGRRLSYAFTLADGRVVGAGGRMLVADDVREADVPDWWRDAVVYTVFVDRFRRGGHGGGWNDAAAWAREVRAGGDLDGVVEALPYLEALGVTALHLTPVAVAPSAHRYDVIDPFTVDPALGGDAGFERLVTAAHDRGLRLIADVTTTHLHRDAAPFRDVAARGPASPYWRWFRAQRWPFHAGDDPGYQHYQKGQWQEPMLATDDPGVHDHLAAVVAHWIDRGVDGVRLDAAADLPLPLVSRLRAAARGRNRDAIVVGEIVPESVERWTAPAALDAATDFAGQRLVRDWLVGAASTARIASRSAELRFRRGGDGARLLGFTGTHDQPRIASAIADAGVDPRAAQLAHLTVLVRAAVPLIYYGDELGLRASDASRDFEDSWPDRQCMPWPAADGDPADVDPADGPAASSATHRLVRAAIALRRAHAALRRGDEELHVLGDDILLIRRRHGTSIIDTLLHRGAGTVTAGLPADGDEPRVLLVHGDATVDGGRVRLGPWSALVIDRSPPPPDLELASGNAAIAARAFAVGHPVSPAYPTRLYLTVTEACNLRCAHCITDAPRLTREGRARTMQPWLLDALDDAFAHADYVAFVHGGESAVAPIFPEVLARIQRARLRRPGRAQVHVSSNAMLLDEACLSRWIDLGVSSLQISLDGASAAVNDRVRVGGSFDRVVANLRAAQRLRDARGADLRVGISTVIGRGNAHQIADLAALAIDVGVDWLKVEETWPATPMARLDALPPDDAALTAAVAAARARLTAAGIVLVDHLAPPTGCPCQVPDVRLQAFRRSDDFANRFTYRPCRVAWEQAAIDPDGTVHLGDYGGPTLGSLLEADLLGLWNGPAARATRSSVLATRSPAQRALCGALP